MQLEGKIKAGNLVLELEETLRSPNLEFLNLSSTDILVQMILYCEGFPGHCRIFNRISGLFLLLSSCTLQLWQLKVAPDIAKYLTMERSKMTPGGDPLIYSAIQSRTFFYILYHMPSDCCRELRTKLLTLVFLGGSFIGVMRRACLGPTACVCYSLGMTLGNFLNSF